MCETIGVLVSALHALSYTSLRRRICIISKRTKLHTSIVSRICIVVSWTGGWALKGERIGKSWWSAYRYTRWRICERISKEYIATVLETLSLSVISKIVIAASSYARLGYWVGKRILSSWTQFHTSQAIRLRVVYYWICWAYRHTSEVLGISIAIGRTLSYTTFLNIIWVVGTWRVRAVYYTFTCCWILVVTWGAIIHTCSCYVICIHRTRWATQHTSISQQVVGIGAVG